MKIIKPTLLIDEYRCRENILMMISKARKNNLDFRPHFKTHQSLEIGRWFREAGTDKITVSSLGMAEYFSKEWDDITVAFPVNILEINTINKLAGRIKLNLLVESAESMTFLYNNLTSASGYFIKIDIGSHRTGIDPSDSEVIDRILEISGNSGMLKFKGFLGHAGHTYHSSTKEGIIDIQNKSLKVLKDIKQKYITEFPELKISIGDTPGCSISDCFSGADEIRPGNFLFYDLMQLGIGSCTEERISIAMACPIVAIHGKRNEIIVYGGGIHFSKERMESKTDDIIYGRVVQKKSGGWGKILPGMYVKNLSQEHGIITVPDNETDKYSIGDILVIIPVHSCLTADCMKEYLTLENKRISMWKEN